MLVYLIGIKPISWENRLNAKMSSANPFCGPGNGPIAIKTAWMDAARISNIVTPKQRRYDLAAVHPTRLKKQNP
jgi:hypothetical protein